MISKFFIDRPIFATVIAILMIIIGGLTIFTLPVAQYPDITPPTVQVSAVYPGASAETVAETVGVPIEAQVNGVEGMMYMSSTSSSDGSYNLTITFEVGTDIDMATEIIFNAKTQRISVCNTAESLLIHKDIAEFALIAIKAKLDEKNVTLYGDECAREICPDIEIATEEDYYREYLDYKMSVKIVSSLEDAIEHIRKYSSGHSESIITNNKDNAEIFLNSVDSSAVYHNASTRFTDGGEFGFGAEIGISTQKLHARGPLGLPQLNSFKYKIYGDGQIR